MTDIFEILGKSIKRQLSIVEDDKNIYLQIVYDDMSSNKYPIGCWFLNNYVFETFSQEEKLEALRLISKVGIQYLPESVRPIFIAKEQEELQKRRQLEAETLSRIQKYNPLQVVEEEPKKKKGNKKRVSRGKKN